MKSMTGYGRGECARDGFKITVELGAVNRRQSEISVNLPRELDMLEAQVRDAINARVARGRVSARITIHAAENKMSAKMHINEPLARAYAAELAKLAKQLKISGAVTLDHIIRAPGVFQTDEELFEAESVAEFGAIFEGSTPAGLHGSNGVRVSAAKGLLISFAKMIRGAFRTSCQCNCCSAWCDARLPRHLGMAVDAGNTVTTMRAIGRRDHGRLQSRDDWGVLGGAGGRSLQSRFLARSERSHANRHRGRFLRTTRARARARFHRLPSSPPARGP